MTINNITYIGNALAGETLGKAVCEAYRQAPDECVMAYMIVDPEKGIVEDLSNVDMPNDPDLLYEKGVKDSKKNWMKGRKVRRAHVIILIGIIIAINIIVLGVVRYRMKRQMS